MATPPRTYGQACAAAHALDLVGERWALLIVRELLLGAKRFTDLRAGLPHASPNVLAQRLRELEDNEILRRRKLGPPSGAWVYELTEWGLQAEPIILELGRWGVRSPNLRERVEESSPDAVMLALRTLFDEESAADLTANYGFCFGEDRFAVAVKDGHLEIARGETGDADAMIHTDPVTLAALLTGRQSIDAAKRKGKLKVTGDERSLKRLLEAWRMPKPVSAVD